MSNDAARGRRIPLIPQLTMMSRAEVRDFILSYDDWYQNFRLGFMLETKHYRDTSAAGRFLGEVRRVGRRAMRRKTKDEVLFESLPSLAGKRVLDIGCNSGQNAFYASMKGAAHVLGVDRSELRIRQANALATVLPRLGQRLGPTEFMVVDDIMGHLDLLDGRDVMMACSVLYHLGPLDTLRAKLRESDAEMLVLQGNVPRLERRTDRNQSSPTAGEVKTWGERMSIPAGMREFCLASGFPSVEVLFPTHLRPVVIGRR